MWRGSPDQSSTIAARSRSAFGTNQAHVAGVSARQIENLRVHGPCSATQAASNSEAARTGSSIVSRSVFTCDDMTLSALDRVDQAYSGPCRAKRRKNFGPDPRITRGPIASALATRPRQVECAIGRDRGKTCPHG